VVGRYSMSRAQLCVQPFSAKPRLSFARRYKFKVGCGSSEVRRLIMGDLKDTALLCMTERRVCQVEGRRIVA
jgi:hypothetical protein